MKKLIASFLLVGLAGCAHMEQRGSAGLDEFLAFADPALCEPAPEHARFLSSMIAGDANEGFRPGRLIVPPNLRSAFGPVEVRRHDGWWTIGVAVTGRLYGLPLKEIVHALPEGGDAGDISYVFAAPAPHVEHALHARRFPAEIGEDVSLGPPDGLQHIMSLTADPDNKDRSVLTCGYA